jgi:hypothetical protein
MKRFKWLVATLMVVIGGHLGPIATELKTKRRGFNQILAFVMYLAAEWASDSGCPCGLMTDNPFVSQQGKGCRRRGAKSPSGNRCGFPLARRNTTGMYFPASGILPPNQAVDALGGFLIDERGNFSGRSHPFSGSLFCFEQLLHGHRLVHGSWPE